MKTTELLVDRVGSSCQKGDNLGIEEGVAMYKKFIHNVVVISTELFYNESVMEINPTVHLIQEKIRKLLYHSLE